MEKSFHHEVSMSLRSPTEHENGWHSQNMLPSSIRHSRAHGNPGLFCAELAWIPAFAGMTEPRRLFGVHIIPSQVFSKEVTKDTKGSEIITPNFVLFVSFVVRLDSPLSTATYEYRCEKFDASHAIFELLQCKGRAKKFRIISRKGAMVTGEYLSSREKARDLGDFSLWSK
ncbi:MAG: hypothetical protein ACXWXZ_10945 [Candidatus Binatia bacterium]